MNEKTILYQLTETSEFMMSFVIITKKDNVIIIDGGRPLDMPLLKKYVGGRHVSVWILTHAHSDHVSGFIDEMRHNGAQDFDIEKIYHHFPEYDVDNRDVACYEYYVREMNEMLPSWNEVLPKFQDRVHLVEKGDQITIDEVQIDFLYTYHKELTSNLMNDSSLVFKVTTPNTSVLFLGDLGPEGGDVLYEESRHLLKADMVQMAHHGHMNCSMEVYEAIGAKICFWCCADWLYNEPEIPTYLEDREKLASMGRRRMYGTAVTRKWMETLGATIHYVTKDGTNRVEL